MKVKSPNIPIGTQYFIILAKVPGWDVEDFGDLILRMKARKDREITCVVTDERNYDFLFNSLAEAGKKEDPLNFDGIVMVDDGND
jgi:hypothetical protein